MTPVANVATFRSNTNTDSLIFLEGYTSISDGGDGFFQWISTDTTSADNGGTIIVDAGGRRYYRSFAGNVNVQWFGARGDGVTNDTNALQAADTYARAISGTVVFPGGTFMVSQLVLYTGSNWRGAGRNATTIKQIIGSNTDLIYGNNSNANWGSTSPTLIVDGFEMQGITLNGNWNGGSGNTTGSGIAAYCARPILRDIFITNCAQYGMRTEFIDSAAGGNDTFTMEGFLENVRIDTVGQHGWWNKGPHDTITIGMDIVDAGQASSNTYDAFLYDAQSGGTNVACHAWNRGSSARHRYALNLQAGAGHDFTGGCIFEGAYSANVGIFGASQNLLDSSTRYFAAWNGLNIYMGQSATQNVIKGYLNAPGVGRPACTGIVMGGSPGDYISANEIDVVSAGQENGNIYFSPFDAGNNKIRIFAYNNTSATFGGTPNSLDDVEMIFQNTSGTSHVKNLDQRTQLSVAASSTATWTFPFAFAVTPIVVFAPALPSAAYSSGVWISSLSTTAVSIHNNNAVSMTLEVIAKASV
jgi:hypothetical protein